MWFYNTFLGLVALMVAGLIGAAITFALMHLGLPRNWFSIGYEVGLGTMKKPRKIPPECLDVFYRGKDYGSRQNRSNKWTKK